MAELNPWQTLEALRRELDRVFDETGTMEIIVFPKTFAKLKHFLNINTAILFKGKIDNKDDKLTVLMENAVNLDQVKKKE